MAPKTKAHNDELFPERRTILRRPNSGICQFCLKLISASNWSRHIRSQHMHELIGMKREESSEEPMASPAECSQNGREVPPQTEEEQKPPDEHSTQERMEEEGRRTVPDCEPSRQNGTTKITKNKNNTNNEKIEKNKPGRGRRGRRTTASGANSSSVGRKKGAAKKRRNSSSRRILCAIKLPKDCVCPLCGRTTSAGNWSRHLKRHHPKFANRGSAESDDAEAIAAAQQEEQRKMMINNLTSTNLHETDFSLVHLEQFLAQQKQHNDFDAFNGVVEQPQQPAGVVEQQQLLENAITAIAASLEERPCMAMPQQEVVDESTQQQRVEAEQQAKETEAKSLNIEGVKQQAMPEELASTSKAIESTSTTNRHHTHQSRSNNNQRRIISAIRPDREGRCPLCAKQISLPNWRRHLLRCHPEEELLAQYKYPDSVFPVPLQTRLFALYAATVQLPMEHLENEFFRKFLSLMPEFDMPSQRMLHAQMDGEVERVKQRLRSALCSHQHQIAVSIDIEGGIIEGQMQQNMMAMCAHFWDRNSTSSSETVGISVCPVSYANEDIVEAVRARLAEMELPLDRTKLVHLTLNKCSAFAKHSKPAFFNPFPYIGGSMVASLPSDSHLVDTSPESMEALFTGDVVEEETTSIEDNAITFDASLSVSVCAAQRLETVLRTVLERDVRMVKLRKRIFGVLEQFAYLHSACASLYARSGGFQLLFPANTRWHTLEHVYARLNRLSKFVGPICAEFKFPTIEEADWTSIERVLEVADTFQKFVAKLEQDNIHPTISLLHPGLCLLLSTLQKIDQIPSVTNSLIEHIKHAFSDVLDTNQNALFLCASMLDPKVAYLTLQEHKHEGICAIRQMIERTVPDPNMFANVVRTGTVDNVDVDLVESPFGFGTVQRARVPPPIIGEATTNGKQDPIDVEINGYLDLVQLDTADSCALFWAKHEQRFPLLSQTARTVLAIPATSAIAKHFLRQSQHNVQADDPESGTRRALITFNRRFIDLID